MGHTKIQIETINTNDYLHQRFGGQGQSPQPCHIQLDCDTGTLTADWNEYLSGMPFAVYHRCMLRWGIPALKADVANELLEELAPIAQRILDGYKSVWDGSNHKGEYTEDAEDAINEIYGRVQDPDLGNDWNSLVVWIAGDWLSATGSTPDSEVAEDLGITKATTDAELKVIEVEVMASAMAEGVDVLEELDDYLEVLRTGEED